jgi:hypothetical protein
MIIFNNKMNNRKGGGIPLDGLMEGGDDVLISLRKQTS